VVCDKGMGSYSGKFSTGVVVSVGAAKKAKFAVRACQAKLSWEHQEIVVAPAAAQADIDVMGADLGLGSLVVALQIKATDTDPHIKYEIYSLSKPSQLLRTITGEDYFNAADTRLESSVEIWTRDAVAVDGFENLPLSAFDFVPTVVLRFENKKLVDVSSEFRPHFDHQIEILRSQLDAQQVSGFKKSDGKLSNNGPPTKDQLNGLLATKIKVLEIAWCYLYSDREQDAWNVLAEMWPPADLDRIRASILNARARGLRMQVDDVSHKPPQVVSPLKNSRIYEHAMSEKFITQPQRLEEFADTAPEQILVMVPRPHNQADWGEKRWMELVIDEAGKVRSAKMREKPDDSWSEKMKEDWFAKMKEAPNKDWIDASAGWKYIPAFRDGHPKAFLLKLYVQRYR